MRLHLSLSLSLSLLNRTRLQSPFTCVGAALLIAVAVVLLFSLSLSLFSLFYTYFQICHILPKKINDLFARVKSESTINVVVAVVATYSAF